MITIRADACRRFEGEIAMYRPRISWPPVNVLTIALPAILLLALAVPALAASGDVKGAKDYPGIGRFGGSVITGYRAKDFDATTVQAKPFKSGKPADERRVEGRITRIAYRTGAGPSILEVARNFETQLDKAGFETLLACDTKECGGLAFSRALDTLPTPQMVVDGFKFRYYAGRKSDGGKDTYATLLVSENNKQIFAQLIVAVTGALENKMVDAAEMAKGLGEKGHIALYGIYFDTDKAVIKPESKPTLDEMAKLLREQPKLNVVIVGHTDSQGGYDYNMSLSKKRADAVALALARTYKIPASRLRTAGVGYLAPVGSNASDDGRALNRRVELVAP
jgi:OOP family OmpA-OmpF porin